MFSNQDYAQDGEILKLEECDTVHPFVTQPEQAEYVCEEEGCLNLTVANEKQQTLKTEGPEDSPTDRSDQLVEDQVDQRQLVSVREHIKRFIEQPSEAIDKILDNTETGDESALKRPSGLRFLESRQQIDTDALE